MNVLTFSMSLDLGMNRWNIGNGIGLEFEMTSL